MNANVSISKMEIAPSQDKIKKVLFSNGQEFGVWEPHYHIESDVENLTVTITSIGESFKVFAIFNDGTIELHELTPEAPLALIAGDEEDVSFIFVSEDNERAFKPEGAYPRA